MAPQSVKIDLEATRRDMKQPKSKYINGDVQPEQLLSQQEEAILQNNSSQQPINGNGKHNSEACQDDQDAVTGQLQNGSKKESVSYNRKITDFLRPKEP